MMKLNWTEFDLSLIKLQFTDNEWIKREREDNEVNIIEPKNWINFTSIQQIKLISK